MSKRKERLRAQLERTRAKLKDLDAAYGRERRRVANSRKFLLGASIEAAVERGQFCPRELRRFRSFLAEYVKEGDPRVRSLDGTPFEPLRSSGLDE